MSGFKLSDITEGFLMPVVAIFGAVGNIGKPLENRLKCLKMTIKLRTRVKWNYYLRFQPQSSLYFCSKKQQFGSEGHFQVHYLLLFSEKFIYHLIILKNTIISSQYK